MNEGYVKSETHKGVTTIEFFHPKSNSLPGKLLEDLTKKIQFVTNHEETKVIILKSAGNASFCAGASFEELITIKSEAEGLKFFSGFANLINAMRKCPKFIIARIQGKCVGGGIGVAAAADYCIALSTAEIRLSELALGIGPLVIGPAVERKIGNAAFSALAIDASLWRNADWAKRKNLFAEVHETVETMDESIFRLTNHLAQSNPDAMAEIKKMLWQGTDDWDKLLKERAAISGRLALSDFAKNAIELLKPKFLKEQ
jgi:methylglutaconyl-CoA hydratase